MAQLLIGGLLVAGHAAYLYVNSPYYDPSVTPASLVDIPWWQPAAMMVGYCTFVAAGLKFMAKRTAIDVSGFMTAYNTYETVLSGWMMVAIFVELTSAFQRAHEGRFPSSPQDWLYTFLQLPVDFSKQGSPLAFALFVNYQSKFLEFCDTVFMILRKKNEQVSALHVIHHAIMGPIMWLVITLSPGGGSSGFGPMMNAGVHTLMYAYYGLTGVGVKLPQLWKQSMTSAQLLQFVVAMAHAGYNAYYPNKYWPMTLTIVQAALMVLMLYMFGDFFKNMYLSPKARKNSREPKAD